MMCKENYDVLFLIVTHPILKKKGIGENTLYKENFIQLNIELSIKQ